MKPADRLDKVSVSQIRGGAQLDGSGVEFALFSQHATKIELCLFSSDGETETARLALHRSEDHIWRGFLDGGRAGLKYGYRVHGPYDPHNGHRFNPHKLLVDPFARELSGKVTNDRALFGYNLAAGHGEPESDARDSAPFMPKCVVTAPLGEQADHPFTPLSESIIYELHVAGYTKLNKKIPGGLRGTFEGLTSDPVLKHMQDLGITAVELLPVYPFNDEPHLWLHGLSNYWGYNPYNFFAPDPRFGNPAQFRAMVQRFHEAGIEVLLDVVYNHTGEGDELGPTLSLRGIDNASFYRLNPEYPHLYVNDTGCGNTLDLAHPYVCEMALSSLRYWAGSMGVDGFRFDLAPIMGRSAKGFSAEAPFFESVREDPLLSSLKMIAEPWDIGPGGYRLGEFPLGWSEWNDQYRDSVRSFWRGDDHVIGELAARLAGSKDSFAKKGRRVQAGVNFITAHDGFTLHDLVSYSDKRNRANGEHNRDGHNHNLSANYGVEGESDDPAVLQLRRRQKRNLLASLMLSQGVPMLQAGDELGRTQKGNNNAYCQDNELNWIDWDKADIELTGFVKKLIRLRKDYPQLRQHGFLNGKADLKGDSPDIVWLTPAGKPMENHDWELPYARCFGFFLAGCTGASSAPLLVLMNAHHEAIDFTLPPSRYSGEWTCLLNTTGEEALKKRAGDVFAHAGHALSVWKGAPAVSGQPFAPDQLYTLKDLGAWVGIERSYHDLSGTEHHLSEEGQRRLLASFGFDAVSDDAVHKSLYLEKLKSWGAPLPKQIILRRNGAAHAPSVPLRLPFARFHDTVTWRIDLENGEQLTGALAADQLPLRQNARIADVATLELELPLPQSLHLGYHELTVMVGNLEAKTALIVAPNHCYRPPWLEAREKLWGIAHQLYALSCNAGQGIGDFSSLGDLAYAAGAVGADILGTNPLHALFLSDPEYASPYSPSSRLFLNPLYLDLTKIEGYESCRPQKHQAKDTGKLVDYSAVAALKTEMLAKLFAHFQSWASPAQRGSFARFQAERGDDLTRFACFEALQNHFSGKVPGTWPQAFRSPDSPQVKAFQKDHAEQITYHSWLQWQADEQLARAAATCAEQGMKVGLYGDLAVGVAGHGSDAWAAPSLYLSDLSFGAPGDAFNADGQNWGMPPLNPHTLAQDAYKPFIEMLRENMRHCGALRIDHVMWLQRMFVIPSGEPASSGAYLRFPLDDLLAVLALESMREKCLVVGEDLGTVPLGFREVMARENILSYRLMRFERDHEGGFSAPASYPYLALATPSSHDLPTLRGYLRGDDLIQQSVIGLIRDDAQLQELQRARKEEVARLTLALEDAKLLSVDYEGAPPVDELVDAIQLYLARSASALTMLNLEDLAKADYQVNVPGTVLEVPNWRHRLDFAPADLASDRGLKALFTLISGERSGNTSLY